jgi:RNA polymerase sigma factor (sigma-70 family)
MGINKNCADGPFRAAEREESLPSGQAPTQQEVLTAVDQALASRGIQKRISRLGLSEDDTADASQDVKLALLRGIARMDREQNFRGYVYRAVSNGLTSVARVKYRSRMKSLSGSEGQSAVYVPDDQPTPLAELAEQEERQRLLAALRTGSRRARRLVDLRLKGLSFEQIGRKLGLSAASVFRLLREQIEQARRRLGR